MTSLNQPRRKPRKPATKAKPKSRAKAVKPNGHANGAAVAAPAPAIDLDPEAIERAFSAWIADLGYGEQGIPADGEFHNFAPPGRSKDNVGAVLNVDSKRIRGFLKDHRDGTKHIWRPNGASFGLDTALTAAERETALAELPERFEKLPSLMSSYANPEGTNAECAKARDHHPYLQAKQIKSFEHVNLDGDVLVLPVRNIRTGKLQNVQRIYPDGGKQFEKGLSKKDGYIPCRAIG
jgi:phage/plasmid primase-like uncharacterized protein